MKSPHLLRRQAKQAPRILWCTVLGLVFGGLHAGLTVFVVTTLVLYLHPLLRAAVRNP